MTLLPVLIQPMLAQIQSADPNHIQQFLIIVGFFLSAGTSLLALANSRKVQKREVTFSEEYVGKGEYIVSQKAHGERMDAMQREVDLVREQDARGREDIIRRLDEMRREISGDLKDVHRRIDQLVEAVGKIKGACGE